MIKRIGLIILAIAVVVIVVLAVRHYADAQAEPNEFTISAALVAVAQENARSHGASFEFKFEREVKDPGEATDLMMQDAFILRYSDGALRSLGLDEMIEMGLLGQDDVGQVRDRVQENVAVGDHLYAVSYERRATYVSVEPGGRRHSGLFALGSRLPNLGYYPYRRIKSEMQCHLKVLSRNIFGQAAESIEACTKVYCGRTSMDRCELDSVNTKAWHFGFVEYEPEKNPSQGSVVYNLCRTSVHYKWGVDIGGIRLGKIFGEINLGNFGIAGSGNLNTETACPS